MPSIIGESDEILELLERVSHLAKLNRPVLIIGERGTGKELVAGRLHYLSKRWDCPFIKLNCCSLNESLLESELFGHEKGAFTGAIQKKIGRFELAHKGTLFLDELASTPASLQQKILRVIEYHEFERVGGQTTVKVDTRIIAATNEDLPTLANQGKFRHDLLDRLSFDVITLPALRYRSGDILLLAHHFAQKMIKELGKTHFPGFTKGVEKQLIEYSWPGNIRELKNVIERAIYQNSYGEGSKPIDQIVFDPFGSPYRPGQPNTPSQNSLLKPISKDTRPGEESQRQNRSFTHIKNLPIDFAQITEGFQRKIITDTLKASKYNQKKAAFNLNLTYHQFRGLLRKFAIRTVD